MFYVHHIEMTNVHLSFRNQEVGDAVLLSAPACSQLRALKSKLSQRRCVSAGMAGKMNAAHLLLTDAVSWQPDKKRDSHGEYCHRLSDT